MYVKSSLKLYNFIPSITTNEFSKIKHMIHNQKHNFTYNLAECMLLMKKETINKNKNLRHIHIPHIGLVNEKPKPKNKFKFNINEKNLLIFQDLKMKTNNKNSREDSKRYSDIYKRYYNKSPIDAMNRFKDVYRNIRTQNEIRIYKKLSNKNNRHPYDIKKFGIFFNTTEYIQFKTLPARLKEQIKLQTKGLKHIPKKDPNKFGNTLKKRSSNEFKNNKESSDRIQNKENGYNDSYSFFESSKSVSIKKNIDYEKLLTRSLGDIKYDQKSKFRELIHMKQSISRNHTYNVRYRKSANKSDELSKMLKTIELMDIKETTDSEFRKTVVDLCNRYAEANNNKPNSRLNTKIQ